MHQIPVYLVEDPNPGAREYDTMSMVLTPRNLIESELFLKVLKKETDAVFNHFADIAPSCLVVAKENMDKKDPTILKLIFELMNEIICRAPCNTDTFVDAVLARSIHYMKRNRYSLAVQDLTFYESLDSKLKTPEGIVISRILSCVSLFLAGELNTAKARLADLNEMIAKSPPLNSADVKGFLLLLAQYQAKISTCVVKEVKPKITHEPIKPYKGFKLIRKIPYASSACVYIGKNAGVFATTDIDKGEIVLVEEPAYYQLGAPFSNCDLCGSPQELVYTCAGCRYKTYCSESCMKDDAEIHQYECYGFKIAIIPLLESTTLYRLFLQAADYILPALVDFALDGGREIKSAKEAWSFILEHAKEEEKEYNMYGDFLANKPDYHKVTKENYIEIITKAFRLAVFIYNDTNLKEKYFYMLALKKEDMIKVIGSILLRLAAHVLLNSHHEKLAPFKEAINENKYPSEEFDELKTKMDRVEENAFSYYGLDAVADFVNCYNDVTNSFDVCGNNFDKFMAIESPIYQFINKVLSLCLNNTEVDCVEDIVEGKSLNAQEIADKIKTLNTSKRCELLKTFTKRFQQFAMQYFTRGKRNRNYRQVKSSICSTLKSFRHCCGEENVKVICMSSGNFIGVTTKKVKSGSELVVCCDFIKKSALHSTTCMEQGLGYDFPLYIRNENHTFGITCSIEDRCIERINLSPDVIRQNMAFICHIKKKVSDWKTSPQDFRIQHDLSVLYGAYNSFLTLHFPHGHPMRLLGVLKFSTFLATNGFLEHSSFIIMHIINVMEKEDTCFEDTALYHQIFCIIRSIIEQYIDIMIDSSDIDAGYPVLLLGSCWCLLKRLMHQIENLKDEEGSSLFAEYRAYHHKWKLILSSYLQTPSGLKKFLVKSKDCPVA
ncbi:uncharacterized protein [Drosophila bipectinata]|uniref:uncharacterized protein isoform X1 n=1 Tax=Drosophila bipectinata TaxID=42026 RepID=UPI0038B26437